MNVRMGRKMAELAEAVSPSASVGGWLASIKAGTTPGTYPVGQAVVFAHLGLSERETFAVHQYGVATMMVSSALRLMKLSYLDAQAILFAVNGDAEADFDRVADAGLEDMAAFAPTFDVLAALHVGATVRMFMN